MSGISYGDKLELSHLLKPGLRVLGSVSRAQELNATVEVKAENREKLKRALRDIYQVCLLLYVLHTSA